MEATENSLILYEGPQEPRDNQPEQPGNNSFEDLREIDRTILACIKDGNDDIQRITSTTGLPNHKVNYSFEKLEEQGLIRVQKPETPVERVIDGQKRVFQVKMAELTQHGTQYLEQRDRSDGAEENQ